MKKIIVSENEEGKRIDAYLSQKLDLSRVMINKMMEEKKITVNKKIQKPSYHVQTKDIIEVEKMEVKETSIKPQEIPLKIIYEDENLLVVNKEKGMVVHPANGNWEGTLVNAIMAYCKDSLSGIGGELRPGIVHRLDKDTSGLLIVAKNDKSHITLSEQLRKHQIKKTYLALVRGNMIENEATINMPITRSTKDRKKMEVNANGKQAITHFKVLERFEKYNLLEVQIETGRTHQIRVHLAQIGHPVIGDMVYSNGKNEFGVEGQVLHAQYLEFEHPITKIKMHLEAPIPTYFEKILNDLRNQTK